VAVTKRLLVGVHLGACPADPVDPKTAMILASWWLHPGFILASSSLILPHLPSSRLIFRVNSVATPWQRHSSSIAEPE